QKHVVSLLCVGIILCEFRVDCFSETGPGFLEQLSQYYPFNDFRGPAQRLSQSGDKVRHATRDLFTGQGTYRQEILIQCFAWLIPEYREPLVNRSEERRVGKECR